VGAPDMGSWGDDAYDAASASLSSQDDTGCGSESLL
jgi:hypothetical protein